MHPGLRVGAALIGLLAAAVLAAPAAAHHPSGEPPEFTVFGDDAFTLGAPGTGLDAAQGPTTFECAGGFAGPYPCKDVDLASFVPLPVLGTGTGNDIWGWTDRKTGREYALMGTATSTGFVDVTDAENPVFLGQLPTSGIPDFVLWRDIKVDGHYAFIVSEVTGHGMQVFDLHRLRDAGSSPQVFEADTVYHGEDPDGEVLSNTHNISINRKTDYAYLVGTNTCVDDEGENGGLHMVDISDPLEPRFAGCAIVPGDGDPETASNNYVHDVECIVYDGPDGEHRGREICFGSNEEVVAIYDVTRKARPKVLSLTGYESAAYTHQGSLTGDRRHFLFGDELDEQGGTVDNTTTYILDVRDIDDPPRPKAFAHETNSIDHNLYVHGSRAFESNYAAGLRILEFDKRSLRRGKLREVAYFDVVPGADPPEFAGTWSNYRFPGSGTVVVSAIENAVSGMFVLKPRLGG